MAQFNTHGGYFAPKGYFKVNVGGSHEENPNGGVQIGVDPQGVPNMLEEGEPVYNDYVFSDNIYADGGILKKMNIPKQYAGKLYSEIADALIDEAEERPNDPISNNGFNKMLIRLADAQEEQKQMQQQKEVEDELSQMSPEELEMLEQMVAQQGAEGDEPAQEEIAPEMAGEQAVPQMPMMAKGGFIRTYGEGGPGGWDAWSQKYIDGYKKQALLRVPKALPLGRKAVKDAVRMSLDAGGLKEAQKAYDKAEAERNKLHETRDSLAQKLSEAEQNVRDKALAVGEAVMSDNYEEATEAYKKAMEEKERLRVEHRKAETAARRYAKNDSTAYSLYAARLPWVQRGAEFGSMVPSDNVQFDMDLTAPVASTEEVAPTVTDTAAVATPEVVSASQPEVIAGDLWSGGLFQNGGQMNRFDGGGLADFLKTIGDYTGSLGKSTANGRYAVDRNAKFWNSRTGRQVEASKGYKDWTDYVYNNGAKDTRLLEYFKKLDELINKETGAATLLDENGNLRKDWQSTWRRRRNDGNLGVYHLTPTNFDYTLPSAQASQAAPVAAPASAAAFASIERPLGLAAMPQPHVTNPGLDFSTYGVRTNPWNNKSLYPTLPSSQYSLFPDGLEPELTDYAGMARLGALSGYAGAGASTTSQAPADSGTKPFGTDENHTGNMGALPVFPMYAGGIGSALLALGNVMQEPTKFHLDPMHVNTPYGRIELQDQVYNPIDQNRLENQVIAQGNATARALQNSGLGPSTAAALLASDAATQRARGEGFLQAWDANNQRRNQVIAANNAAEAQRAQFDFGVDKARTDALNTANMMDRRYQLMIQQLNDQAESQQYAALSQNLSNALESLTNIGRQNAILNQANSNRALYDRVWPNMWATYKG